MELIDRGQEPPIQTIRADALKAFRIMKAGGVAVLPLSVSYAIFAHTARAVERIFELKQRAQTKPNGVIGNWDIFNEVLHTTQSPTRERVESPQLTNGRLLPSIFSKARSEGWSRPMIRAENSRLSGKVTVTWSTVPDPPAPWMRWLLVTI